MKSPNEEYTNLSVAYRHFNDTLFGGCLPGAIITLHSHPRARGYFRRRAFSHRLAADVVTDEICLCPDTHAGRSDGDILSTLVHEQVHQWQVHHGSPPRRCYHDRQWAAKLEEVGLMPSDTGMPGGKKTGQSMTHFIIAGGPFDASCQALLATGWRLQWEQPLRQATASSRLPVSTGNRTPKATRRQFVCPQCRLEAQATPTARIVCGTCSVEMG